MLGNPPPAWVSELAEELAPLAAAMDGLGISRRIKEEAQARAVRPWDIAYGVAQEWDRMGIVRAPVGIGRMGG